MGALFKLILCLYLLSLLFSLFVALIAFLVDVFKWHDVEKKVKLISSGEMAIINGKEVENNGRNDNGEHRTGDTGTGADGTGDTDGDTDREPLVF